MKSFCRGLIADRNSQLLIVERYDIFSRRSRGGARRQWLFASRHHLRARIIPSSPQPLAPTQLSLCLAPGLPDEFREAASIPRRIGWAGLLARVFAVDVTVCSKCGGRMKILEVVTDPEAITRLLHGARAPPRPCLPGQLGLFV